MKNRWLMIAGVLLLGLALAALCYGLHREERPSLGGSGAAQGLMLLERDTGLYVLAVTQDSPADKAGVQPGDDLIRAAGETLETAAQLDELINAAPETLTLTVSRDGRKLQLELPTR